ncbi:MAG: HlyD family efflux transporter periplasmic adaptor subunit [Bryobacterales bacterium]|nr:HlyD family efflux transporter periplasmic adaptor subunit [Bryobacterales bacterium]
MGRAIFGRFLGALIVVAAVASVLLVVRRFHVDPQTDDAEVFANLIGIAPEVEGRIVKINVQDNEFVRKGQLLFQIDPVPYQYALETARSQQATLQGQIRDLQRTVGAQTSAIQAARANSNSAQAKIASADAGVEAARASVDAAKAALSREQADYAYAENNVLRLEPLLVKQFVTVDMVDQARTSRSVKGEAVRQARSRLALSEAQWAAAVAQQKEAVASYQQSQAQVDQSIKSVGILDPLVGQRMARESAVKNAEYNLQRSNVYAPFDARVTNLSISEGAYAHVGQQVFTLIDARTWWVIANFRETDLRNIQPGTPVDVYLMSRANRKFQGVVESIGFGVTPDESLIGKSSGNLPDVQRSLDWVHLATRFPVRIRIERPAPDQFRVGASAMVVVRGKHSGRL